MQNIVWKWFTIVAVLALCILSLSFKDLRLGKDLRGGVSLVYQVDIPADSSSNSQEILTQTISVLKERVNPKGVLDISMQPLGRDRIEIVMPLPNTEVRELDRAYRLKLAELLRESEIPPSALDEALQRGDARETLGGAGESERARKVTELQAAYAARDDARAALEQAEAAGSSAEALRPLQFAVAAAENTFDDLYAAVLRLSLGESRVRRTLNLPTNEQKVKNPDGTTQVDEAGDPVMGPSQRDDALARIRADFSHISGLLEETVVAHDAYQDKRTGFDDPDDLIRLLRGAGVLEFHVAVTNSAPGGVPIQELRDQLAEVGPDNVTSGLAMWFPINQLKNWYDTPAELAALERGPVTYFSGRDLVAALHEGEHYLLLFQSNLKSMTHGGSREWSIVQTFPTVDSLGRPAVSFQLDASGGGLMGRMTGSHIGQPMAIVLDGEVYSAPTIQGQISSNGQITGNFSQAELSYLLRVLNAGSLQARLSPAPIAVSTLGPSIGQDNLQRGKGAFIIALIAVGVFMLVYYLFAGFVANLALLANGVIIFGVMTGIDGTFTLPGLAGIVLTIGMAVDANVLIYERIREEIFDGEEDLRIAIRQGYGKALSTILDANITNLIVCFVLFKTATTEVKGFALTLTIGICATLFTALFVTRQIYYLYTDVFKAKKLAMLPTIIPAIHRALEPSINWLGMRKIFWTISTVAVIGSVALVWSRGVDMFDTEFRGGVSLTMETTPLDDDGDGNADVDENGEIVRKWLAHTGPGGVEERIRDLGRASDPTQATTDAERARLTILRELATASILTADQTLTDPATGGVMAHAFQIKVASPKGLDDTSTITDVVVDEIVGLFGADLDVTQPLTYDGGTDKDSVGHVFPIEEIELGKNIGVADATRRVPEFVGGAAIVLRGVEPPVTPDDVVRRIDRMRNQPDFVKYSARKVNVIGLTSAVRNDPSAGYVDLVILVNDPYKSYQKTDSEVWFRDVAQAEWELAAAALQRPTSFKQVSSFSSAVAGTMSAQAIVAVILTLLGILVYIWVRFGSLRYSVAAIVALLHDVTISLGVLAFSAIIGGTAIGSILLIEPFRIDLGVVAALLTIIGYSLNDTIVILDRIRENRGKLPLPTAPIVNRSINQTVSRTLLTSVTTLLAVGIMYAEGGSGIRPFTFCLLIGLVVGTYSSVAIASPLVFRGKADDETLRADRYASASTPVLEETAEPAPSA